ncbi:unnamed protein product [Brachionus calyciflorus]|uniref:Uncharacterized protein n=1 Tax=Brachionus calyciflorus TaxID=104777 RepID=A0A814GLB4_9BILA|nr:unnamed protein product [Brachionus calyciflorus]
MPRTIRVRDQSTQTSISLHHNLPIINEPHSETPERLREEAHRNLDLPRSSNKIDKTLTTPINKEDSNKPRFILTVSSNSEETNSPRPEETTLKKTNSLVKKKLNFIDDKENSDHNEQESNPTRSELITLPDESNLEKPKKRGRPKKNQNDEDLTSKKPKKNEKTPDDETIKSKRPSSTGKLRNKQKLDDKEVKSDPGLKGHSMTTRNRKEMIVDETPQIPRNEPSTSKRALEEDLAREEDIHLIITSRGTPYKKRQKLHKKKENLVKKMAILDEKLEHYYNPDRNLRRSERIRLKMIAKLEAEKEMLMHMLRFVEQQDELLIRQEKKVKDKSDHDDHSLTPVKRPIRNSTRKFRIVSDSDEE